MPTVIGSIVWSTPCPTCGLAMEGEAAAELECAMTRHRCECGAVARVTVGVELMIQRNRCEDPWHARGFPPGEPRECPTCTARPLDRTMKLFT